MKKFLKDFASNEFSQWGEDGIVRKILAIIGLTSGTTLEFGAWDGFHYSNTASLWTRGWGGILIEGDSNKYNELVENIKKYDKCIAYNYYVGHDESNSIETILKQEGISFDIDLISIDIDGNEYYIIESMKSLRPKIVIAEYNPTMPFHEDMRSEPDEYSGCSATALINLMSSMSYFLSAVTDTNCIFIHQNYYDLFSSYELSTKELATYKYCTFVVTDYSGKKQVLGNPPYGLGEDLTSTLITKNTSIKRLDF